MENAVYGKEHSNGKPESGDFNVMFELVIFLHGNNAGKDSRNQGENSA